MCGIFGLAGPRHAELSRERQARSLGRRGPDGFGQRADERGRVYLAHTRLAVIDLSPRGAQPMCNEDGTVWITFNGEIYGHAALRAELEDLGHRFASATDTEVIVHAYEQWGIECLSHLNGMFAFGLWDSRCGKLFLARDRLGIKPLYWGLFDGTLAFASDSRALVGLPFVSRDLEPAAVCCYLLYKYVSGEQSIWRSINRLLPGHLLEFDVASGRSRTRRYWTLPLEERDWRVDDALERFSRLFADSVRDCLVSDVPLGVFLSGGYDSSAVARTASRFTRDLHTFSIGFEGWDRDERAAAAHTASRLGTVHREAVLGSEQFATLDEVIGAYDEPLADSSTFPTYLLCREVRRQATVALSGDGGDELLGGYSWYRHTVHAAAHKRLAFVLEPFLQAAGLLQTSWGQRCSSAAHYRLMSSPTFSLSEVAKLFPVIPAASRPDDAAWLYRSHLQPGLSGYRRWQYVDLHTFLVDTNLTKVDRASMAHGLEVRVPFLDHRIAEFAYSLPEQLRCTRGQHKVLLAHWLRAQGLAEVVARPKQGFSSPWQRFWPPAAMSRELTQGWLVSRGWVDRGELQTVLDRRHPHRDLQLLVLATLDRWGRQWVG
jgi:asparagine synthase (glutamine-hydrolysing)